MNNLKRCPWCLGNNLYTEYHDSEWGVQVHDDKKHFEFLVLESAQAGLSWLTILKRREHYRRLYENFDAAKVARFDDARVEMMLTDPGIIRNRKKIESSITNAVHFLEIAEEFSSFDNYIWNFTDGQVIRNQWKTIQELPANTSLSDRISKDLKSRGFKFLGTTTLYAHLQAVGIINDHLVDCFRYDQV
jgi:DNA-3-methyladenine glycosylase I